MPDFLSPVIVYEGKAYQLGKDELPLDLSRLIQTQLSKAVVPLKLENVYCLTDFDNAAYANLSDDTWAYYRTGADDEITLNENIAAFQRIFFRPRVLENVSLVNQSTTLFGTKTASPFYISAFAESKLGHDLAEKNLTWASNECDVIQMIPLMSKFTLDEIADEKPQDKDAWLQVYVNSQRDATDDLLERAIARGIKAVFFTVDTAQLGNREFESRVSGEEFKVLLPQDPALSWQDILAFQAKLKPHGIKVVIKGVQCKEDAIKAFHYGIDGILISNHGGRQLDTARSTIEVLEEVMDEFEKQSIYRGDFGVFVDGGIRRGSDVVKALCLGADGIGLGRPFLYAMSSFGKDGVVRAINILKREIDCCLRLLGVDSVKKLHRGLVVTNELSRNRYTKS